MASGVTPTKVILIGNNVRETNNEKVKKKKQLEVQESNERPYCHAIR